MKAPRPSLLRFLPDKPGLRYTVFSATNSWREWFAMWPRLLSGRAPSDAVSLYEIEAARRTGCAHAISFGAGRMGLYQMLEALNLQAGDEIILPGFTCTVVPNAMVYRGIRPIYVDIEPTTFNIDPALVERAITPRTRAIFMQHTFGVSCDVPRLREIARTHGLLVIEDLAHSLGGAFGDTLHGACGNVGFFSSDRTKVINTHVGGCVVTSDADLALRLRALQQTAQRLTAWQSRKITFSFLSEFLLESPPLLWLGRPILGAMRRAGMLFYWTDEPMDRLPAGYPYPCQLPAPQAALGLWQLQSLDKNLRHRRAIARRLEDWIGWYGGDVPGGFDRQAWLRYSFLVKDRDEFVGRFGRNIDLGIWFLHPIFCREHHTEAVGYEPGQCPIAEMVARHIVNLPTHRRIPLALMDALRDRHGDWLRSQIMRVDRCVPAPVPTTTTQIAAAW